MKKIIYFSLFAFHFSFISKAQTTAQGCDGKRYLQDVFTTVNVNTDKFGSAITASGYYTDLMVDIYQPKGDTIKKRPLIVFAFGGGFVLGTRSDDYMVALCQTYTKKGYVCASIDYRLFSYGTYGFPDSNAIAPIIVQAQQDMRAAVRYFKRDAATSNLYGIDTTNIIVGGVSAGAITAMNVGYLSDTTTNIPAWLKAIIKTQGGVEGGSGNPGYTSNVKGVVSMSGGLYQKEWINKNSPPFVAYHGTADSVVPYGYGINVYKFYTQGDKTCSDYAKSIGVPSVLLTVPGGGHVDIYDNTGKFTSYLAQWNVVATTFLKQLVCGEKINVSTPTEDIATDFKVGVFPNPSQDFINLEIQGKEISNYSAEVVDLSGRIMKKYTGINNTSIQINKSDIGHGLFFVKVTDNSGNSTTQKIVFTN